MAAVAYAIRSDGILAARGRLGPPVVSVEAGKVEVMSDNKKKPNPVDIHVGSRVRLRRTMLGMSQERLGESLGITFQQIQKYEKGSNRIGASRLQKICEVLNVPIAFFFEDAPQGFDGPAGLREPSSPNYVVDFLSTPEGLQLNRAFVRIADAKVRRRVIDLVKVLADAANAEGEEA